MTRVLNGYCSNLNIMNSSFQDWVKRTPLSAESKKLRRRILEIAHLSGEGHVPSSFSIVEMLLGCFQEFNFGHAGADKFVLSKGHAALGLYVCLEEFGEVSKSELDRFCLPGSKFGGHPDSTLSPAIHASTGSLGHGLPMSVGMAYANVVDQNEGKIVVMLGDGECNEGSVWEAALLASSFGLQNIIALIDFNLSGERALALGDLRSKWEAFGWNSIECDGHDPEGIRAGLRLLRESKSPGVLVCKTIKGYGINEMENNPAWHHSGITSNNLAAFSEEL